MSRYIDAEKYRKDLIELGFLPTLVVRALDKQPTADVVEVVRCKDCRYKDECNQYVLMTGEEKELAYCSFGERRTDDEGYVD